jgi:hypothetical protein
MLGPWPTNAPMVWTTMLGPTYVAQTAAMLRPGAEGLLAVPQPNSNGAAGQYIFPSRWFLGSRAGQDQASHVCVKPGILSGT